MVARILLAFICKFISSVGQSLIHTAQRWKGAVDTQQEIGSGVEKDVPGAETSDGAQTFMIYRPGELDGTLVSTI